MKYLMCVFIPFLLCACTYSITMVHTEGTADDIVDESSTPSTSISPNISIPASII